MQTTGRCAAPRRAAPALDAAPLAPRAAPARPRAAPRPAPRRAAAASAASASASAAAAAAPPAAATEVRDYGVTLWAGTKRLQVVAADVAPATRTLRSLDWDRDRFDIEFGLQNGTTYNSYLIFGANATALVDASHEKFRGPWLAALQAELAAAGRSKIDYIFVSHTEPDHSGLIPDVVQLYPEAVVCGSKVALAFLANLAHAPLTTRVVKVRWIFYFLLFTFFTMHSSLTC
jgi:hypothetical protein